MAKSKTPSFVTDIPLAVSPSEEQILLARLEAGRQLYNACLGESVKRLDLYKQSKLYQFAKTLPKGKERTKAFQSAREFVGYTEYALHSYATEIRNGGGGWIAKHIDANTAQKLATRAFGATERVNFGKAKRVRFKSKNQLDSLEGKTNTTGIRWKNEQFQWSGLVLNPLIDENDPVILHGLNSPVKYVRLVRRKVKGKNLFYAQLINKGKPFQKPKYQIREGVVGLDIGTSTIAIVGNEQAELKPFCDELANKDREVRRLQRKMERQRRANNPDNFEPDFVDAKGRKKKGKVKKGAKRWNHSKTYLKTRQRKAEIERQLTAHRKSLQNQLAHEVFSLGNVVKLEKLSYKAFQRMYGKSVGRRAPGMFVERLRRIAETAASATVFEFPTRETKLSQRCLCGRIHKKPLSQRVHRCECGIVAQRDLFSGFLGQFVDLETACFNATLANQIWGQGWDTILMTAWQQATTLYNQSSIGKPMVCQRSGNAASERIVSKALGEDFKTQDAVALCESLGEKPIT
ncbi:MAG: transposase [Synechococcales bacterium]|nr:transposase [Synechococcales bacterium]